MKPATVRYSIKCIVPSCNNKMSENRSISYFSFPKDPIRCSLWVEKCGIDGNIDVSKNHIRVCGEHFENRCFLNDLKNRLQSHAVPTLFTDMSSQDKISTLDDVPKTCNELASTTTSIEVLASPLNMSGPRTSLNFSIPCSSISLASDTSYDSPLAFSSPSSDKSAQTLKIWSDKTPRKSALRAQLKLEKERRQQAESTIAYTPLIKYDENDNLVLNIYI